MSTMHEPQEVPSLTESQDIYLKGPWAREHKRRVTDIDEAYGFLPHTLAEAAIITAVKSNETRHIPQPLSAYLKTEFNHHTEHGKEAVEAIVETMIQAAGNALNETGYALQMMHTIQGYTLDGTMLFADVYPVADWDPTTVAQLTSLARRTETAALKDGRGPDLLPKKSLLDNLPVEKRVERIQANLSGLTAQEVLELARASCVAEDARFEYWYQQLVTATSSGFVFVREQVAAALRDFIPYKNAIDARASVKAHGML